MKTYFKFLRFVIKAQDLPIRVQRRSDGGRKIKSPHNPFIRPEFPAPTSKKLPPCRDSRQPSVPNNSIPRSAPASLHSLYSLRLNGTNNTDHHRSPKRQYRRNPRTKTPKSSEGNKSHRYTAWTCVNLNFGTWLMVGDIRIIVITDIWRRRRLLIVFGLIFGEMGIVDGVSMLREH